MRRLACNEDQARRADFFDRRYRPWQNSVMLKEAFSATLEFKSRNTTIGIGGFL